MLINVQINIYIISYILHTINKTYINISILILYVGIFGIINIDLLLYTKIENKILLYNSCMLKKQIEIE